MTDLVEVRVDGSPVDATVSTPPTGASRGDSVAVTVAEASTDRAHEIAVATASCDLPVAPPAEPSVDRPADPPAAAPLPATGYGTGIAGLLLALSAAFASANRSGRPRRSTGA